MSKRRRVGGPDDYVSATSAAHRLGVSTRTLRRYTQEGRLPDARGASGPEQYTEQLHAAGAPRVDFDTAWRLYRQNLLSTLAWYTGTLGQPPEAPKMQPPATSREFIRRMTAAIDDLDALDSFG